MKLVRKACEEAGFSFEVLDKLGNLARVVCGGKEFFFAYTTTPFNREDVQHIASDKFLTYTLLADTGLMPRTKRYLRPDLDPTWHDQIEFANQAEIIADMTKNFKLPFVVKMNAGSLGRNVFVCKNIKDIERAVDTIFKEDWALLAQEFAAKRREFRVLIVDNDLSLVYTKGGGEFFDSKSEVWFKMKSFLLSLQGRLNLGWAGLDVIEDNLGKFWLIEVNTKPSLVSALKAGQENLLKPLYLKAFKNLGANLSS